MTWAEAAIELSAILKQIDKEFLAKDAEIERLKGENARLKQLITELATYLEGKRRERYDGNGWISTLDEEGEELLKHLREATR
jgi:hypothetical protein